MSTLRVKLTLTLLVATFASIAAVGASARWITLSRFDDLITRQAAEGFMREITAYYEEYGSWEEAEAAEPFPEFARQMRARRPRPGGFGPTADLVGPGPGGPADPSGRRPFVGGTGPARGPGATFGSTAPPFVVVDEGFTALLTLGPYRRGDPVPEAESAALLPVRIGDAEVGYAIALERPQLTALEQEYLDGIEQAWISALLGALVLAVPFGLWAGTRFTRPLTRLTDAIEAMERGQLRQSLPVPSTDEVGTLTEAFNRMSGELANAHDALEASQSRLSEQAAELEELSRRDPLTGLLNRRAFDDLAASVFAQAIRYDQPLAVAIADLDHFKRVNDQHSHAVGDEVLRRTSARMARELRESDVIARYGGEEFVILLPQTEPDGARRQMERLRQSIESEVWDAIAPGLRITLSIGGATREVGDSVETMLSRADERLYAAKAAGRNRVEV